MAALERWAASAATPRDRGERLLRAALWELRAEGLETSALQHLRDAVQAEPAPLAGPAALAQELVRFCIEPLALIGVAEVGLDAYERDAIRPRVLGRFEDLLVAVAQSPAMLYYLDNQSNSGGNPNENYARELCELFCLGVDNGYDQTDIEEISRGWTGWRVEMADLTNVYNPHATITTNRLPARFSRVALWLSISPPGRMRKPG